MLHLWGFSEELGIKEKEKLRFWHKMGPNSNKGQYLENDMDVFAIKQYITDNYEVEIYIEDMNGETEPGCGSDEDGSESDDDGSGSDGVDDDENDEDFYESGYEFEEDDRIFDSHVDHDAEILDNRVVIDHGEIRNDVLCRMQDLEGDADCVDIDELCSGVGSDDDDYEAQKFPLFDPIKDAENPDLQIGMIFSSRDEAKFAIESHCIRQGKSVRFVKIDKRRLRGKCKNEGCEWLIRVSSMGHDSCWQIKTFKSKHNNCFWDHRNRKNFVTVSLLRASLGDQRKQSHSSPSHVYASGGSMTKSATCDSECLTRKD